MSKLENNLDTKYAELCKRLGDAILKREQLDRLITDIKSDIEALNKNYPLIIQLLNQAKEHSDEK